MKIDKDRIANAWRNAANDLGIDVTAPFSIELEDHSECEFIALIKRFGTLKGTLICLPEEWDDFGYHYLAEDHGYYCSGVYAVYEQYEKGVFIDTLNDWGWFGDESAIPCWYKAVTDPAV
jgi:hypothetical protein